MQNVGILNIALENVIEREYKYTQREDERNRDGQGGMKESPERKLQPKETFCQHRA